METTRAKRGVHPLGIGVGWLLMGATLWAQDTNSPLEIFQRFANGKVPVKDAVVYRKLTKLDGTLMDEEWMRFGYQDKTMFVFRLTRDPNNASQLISLPRPETFGASFDQIWTINDRILHVADKEFALGSVPDTHGAFPRSLAISSLALGIPCLENTNIQWSGSNFTSKILIHRDATGIANETASVKGRLLLGADGIPKGAEYSGVASSNDTSVTYEYEPSQRGIPVAFTIKFKGTDPGIFRFEFLSLTLGKVNLEETGGYVPTMFGNPTLKRTATIWVGTNYQSVDQLDIRLPAITTLRTNLLSFTIPKQTGSSRQ